MLSRLGLAEQNMTVEVFPHIPRAMGLGGSSALAVAICGRRYAYDLNLSDGRINELAFECETAHGTPSGIDNTVATYVHHAVSTKSRSKPAPGQVQNVNLGQSLELVIGVTGKESLTADGSACTCVVAAVPGSIRQYLRPDRTAYELGHEALRRSTRRAR